MDPGVGGSRPPTVAAVVAGVTVNETLGSEVDDLAVVLSEPGELCGINRTKSPAGSTSTLIEDDIAVVISEFLAWGRSGVPNVGGWLALDDWSLQTVQV